MRSWLKAVLIVTLTMLTSLSLTFTEATAAPKRASKKAGAGKGFREKHITREATMKSKDQSKVDFEAVDIGGARKAPMGTLINQNKADKNYDFVKVRLRWHPEMVQSASSLDTGAK